MNDKSLISSINFYKLLIICLFSVLVLSVLTQIFLIDSDVYYKSYSNQLSLKQIDDLLNLHDKFQYLSYLFIVVFYLIKFLIIGSILYVGILFFNVKIVFKSIFRVVILSEFIFVICLLFKFFWFLLFDNQYTIEELQLFYPLSILNILDLSTIDNIWIYPLQLLNVFELTYWIALAYGISKLINNNFDKALKIVLSSYVPAMVVWIVFVMFLTVTLNPS